MKVIKMDGRTVDFNSQKIERTIEKANKEVDEFERVTKDQIYEIINYVEDLDKKRILVEDIKEIIEEKLIGYNKLELAKKYVI